MEKHGVVPDVIDAAPANSVTIKYDCGVEVNNGNELTPTQVQNQPTTFEYASEPNTLYTVLMVDPDAPSRADPQFREILHWMVVNVPGSDVNKGDALAFYIGSGPPEGTGLHRYITLIYKQAGKVTLDLPEGGYSSREARRCFNTRQFAAKYNLGQPIAGNFYQAQYDEYVLVLRAKYSSAAK